MSTVVLFFHLLTACVWVGGFVALVVVTRVARARLEPRAQIAFFRTLGRVYGIVSGVALLVALGTGAALLAGHALDAAVLAAIALAAALLVATGAGVVQARGMTALRRRAMVEHDDARLSERVRRGTRRALALRAAIGALTLALLAVGAVLAT